MVILSKKAQGMSINTIILVALGLIILVIFTVIVSCRFQFLGRSLSECDGQCVTTKSACSNGAPVPTTNCVDGSGVPKEGAGWCCKKIV